MLHSLGISEHERLTVHHSQGGAPFCVTSFMTNSDSTYSRFMCGTVGGAISMAYSSQDTPQFTANVSASAASSASLSAASESAASMSSELASLKGTSTDASAAAGATSTGDASATQAQDKTADGDKSPNASKGSDGGSKGGVVAGAVVGSIAGIGLIGAAAFVLIRKRKQKNADDLPHMTGVPVSARHFSTSQISSPMPNPAAVAATPTPSDPPQTTSQPGMGATAAAAAVPTQTRPPGRFEGPFSYQRTPSTYTRDNIGTAYGGGATAGAAGAAGGQYTSRYMSSAGLPYTGSIAPSSRYSRSQGWR